MELAKLGPKPYTEDLRRDFRTTIHVRAGGLLARTGSLSGHPSKQQPRSTLLDLSFNNRRTRYTRLNLVACYITRNIRKIRHQLFLSHDQNESNENRIKF
ncbi:hypothetical protein J6590_002291 [Homalodisca vitripennis]|nr:hypothetical protein J6590_002291 [Homalodisca vitripennis]